MRKKAEMCGLRDLSGIISWRRSIGFDCRQARGLEVDGKAGERGRNVGEAV